MFVCPRPFFGSLLSFVFFLKLFLWVSFPITSSKILPETPQHDLSPL